MNEYGIAKPIFCFSTTVKFDKSIQPGKVQFGTNFPRTSTGLQTGGCDGCLNNFFFRPIFLVFKLVVVLFSVKAAQCLVFQLWSMFFRSLVMPNFMFGKRAN